MIISDFHTHSSNSGDSDTKMQFQIESAINKGIKHLCITEHMDIDYPAPPKGHESEFCDFFLNYDPYKKEFDEMYKKYCESSSGLSDNSTSSMALSYFNLYHGVELGLQPQVADKNREFVKGKNFDFIIGSCHLVDGEDPYYPEYYIDKIEDDVFRNYFKYIYENISAFDDFDVLGHLDYIVRYGVAKDKNYSYIKYADEIDTILKWLIEKGKGIEINTGGIRNGLKYPNPCPDILRRYIELHGEIITVGSDAHEPDIIANNFDVAEAILKDVGFKYYTIFKGRKPEFIKL